MKSKIIMINKRYIKIILSLVFIISIARPAQSQDTVSCFDKEDLEKYNEMQVSRIIRKSKPIIKGYWVGQSPSILLCKGSGVKKIRLEKAINFWEKIGYKFGTIVIEENTLRCHEGGWFGEISILLITQDLASSDKIAVTRTHTQNDTGEIIKAQIYMNPSAAGKPLVLEHEIGHALGWAHFNQKYHLMNKAYPHCGHTTSGISFKNYQSQIESLAESKN